VVFSARNLLGEGSPEVFAQRVASLFGGTSAVVERTSWLGRDKEHLKVTLTLPLAEDIGSNFWKGRQSLRVEYFLAPCRTRLLRDAMSRMITTIRALKKLPELLVERTSATSVSFLGMDSFDAMDFLYPAVRLGDGRILQVSNIVNDPHAPIFLLPPNPALHIPGPQTS
jgi:hypothetical protein